MNRGTMNWLGSKALLLATVNAAIFAAQPAAAQQQRMREFDIPSQSLSTALLTFSRQSGEMVVASPDMTNGKISRSLRGQYPVDQAISELLSGSGLHATANPQGGYLIERARPSRSASLLTYASQVQEARPTASAIQEEEPANPGVPDDIIVTARKRDESILRVPVIATAITQEKLTNYAVNSMDSIANEVSGLQIGEGGGNNGKQVSLRGVGAGVTNPGIEQSVSLNIDGVQMTSGNAFKLGMFDLAQVEVLKGPQSLFFGKNSPGGVISLRTADPGADLQVIARASYEFEAREKRIEAIVSGPVSDTLGLRLASSYADSDGYFYNRAIADARFGALQPSSRFGGSEDFIIRGTALWKPSSRFRARLKVNYNHSDSPANSAQAISCPDGTGAPSGVPFITQSDCKADRTIYAVDMDPTSFPLIGNGGRTQTKYDQGFGSLELNYDIGNITLTSVSGYYEIDQTAVFSGSTTSPAGPAFGVNGWFDRNDFTQEVRLTSDFRDKPINFMVGAFYQDGKIGHRFQLPGNAAYKFPANLNSASHQVDVEAISAFGQLIYRPSQFLELAGGARWTQEKRQHKVFNTISGTPVPIALGVPKLKSDNLSPEFTITWTPNDDLTLFASYKQGFKSGSFNVTGTPPAGSDNSFGDEKVKGGEIGVKTRLADRSVMLNVAAYYYRYDDLQVGASATDIATGSFGVRTLNAASAKLYGIDAELRYFPRQIEGLSLNASANWNHARYIEFANAQCWGGQTIAEGCNLNPNNGVFTAQDLSGRELLRAPEWSMTAGMDYESSLKGDWILGLGWSLRYSSSYYTNFLLRDDMVQNAYAKLNARVSLKQDAGPWGISLIGNNLTDKTICGSSTDQNSANGIFFGGVVTGTSTRGSAGVNELNCRLERGREVIVRVSVEF